MGCNHVIKTKTNNQLLRIIFVRKPRTFQVISEKFQAFIPMSSKLSNGKLSSLKSCNCVQKIQSRIFEIAAATEIWKVETDNIYIV